MCGNWKAMVSHDWGGESGSSWGGRRCLYDESFVASTLWWRGTGGVRVERAVEMEGKVVGYLYKVSVRFL